MAIHALSLCSGIGGLDLGLKVGCPGFRTVCYVEREAYAAATLVARMEESSLDKAPIWDDVATFDGKPWRENVDIILAGYPCQPFSQAGTRKGTKDERHLWPHISRIIKETKPEICFFENVARHLTNGFEEIWRDLRQMGFEVEAGIYSPCEAGAPHLRRRLFILAYASGARLERYDIEEVASPPRRTRRPHFARPNWWNSEPGMERVANGIPNRLDRLRCLGNAVVPAVVTHAWRHLLQTAREGMNR